MFALTYTLKMKEMWKYWLNLWLKQLYVIFEYIFRFLVISYTIKPKTHSNIWLHSGLFEELKHKDNNNQIHFKINKTLYMIWKEMIWFLNLAGVSSLKINIKKLKNTWWTLLLNFFYPPSLVSVQSPWIDRLGALNSNFNVKTTL